MFNFADLARSGTAPTSVSASPKLRAGDTTIPTARMPVRPTTRGADSDISELNVNLKINRARNTGSNNYVDVNDYAQEDVGYIQAIESFQAAIDNWTDQRAQFNPSIGGGGGGGVPHINTNMTAGTNSSSMSPKTNNSMNSRPVNNDSSNNGRPPNRRATGGGTGAGGYSAYTQDPASFILNNQRPKTVKSASLAGKDSKTDSRLSRNQQVVAAYGSISSANKIQPTSGMKVVNKSSGIRSAHASSSGSNSDLPSSNVSSNMWMAPDNAFSASRSSKGGDDTVGSSSSSSINRRPNSTSNDRSRVTATASAVDKKLRKAAAPSPLLSATPSPSKSNLQQGAPNTARRFSDSNDEYNADGLLSRDITDISPGIYIDETSGLDESFPDASQFELLRIAESHKNNGIGSKNNAAAHSHHPSNSMVPVESDASFGFPMGNDDIDGDGPERPQSRKLYLGAQGSAEKHNNLLSNNISPEERRKLPQSAGIRSVALYPDVSISNLRRIPSLKDNLQFNSAANTQGSDGGSGLGAELGSGEGDDEEVYDDCVTVVATDGDIDAHTANRPPSRQRSAFPVHLTDTSGAGSSSSSSSSSSSGNAAAGGAGNNAASSPLSIYVGPGVLGREGRSNSLPKSAITGSGNAGSSSSGSSNQQQQQPSSTVVAHGSTGPMVVASKPIKLTGNNASNNASSSSGGNNNYGNMDHSPDQGDDAESLEKSLSQASLSMQRPPSRQKLAAQNLFERNNPRSSAADGAADTDSPNSGSRRNSANRAIATSSNGNGNAAGGNNGVDDSMGAGRSRASSQSHSPDRISDVLMQDMAHIIAPATAVPSKRINNVSGFVKQSNVPSTAPVQTLRNNGLGRSNDPASDGFLDLEYDDTDVPFQIIVNRSSPSSNMGGRVGPSPQHPFSPFSDGEDIYDHTPNLRSQTAPNNGSDSHGGGGTNNSKLLPLGSSTSAGGRRPNNLSNALSSSGSSGSASSSAGAAVVNNNNNSSSSGSTGAGGRPGRRFLNNGGPTGNARDRDSNANNNNSGNSSGWALSGATSPPNSNPSTVRGSGGWMSATADVRTGVSVWFNVFAAFRGIMYFLVCLSVFRCPNWLLAR
jgi:hypothetical protein